jgi:hypothetical protein
LAFFENILQNLYPSLAFFENILQNLYMDFTWI